MPRLPRDLEKFTISDLKNAFSLNAATGDLTFANPSSRKYGHPAGWVCKTNGYKMVSIKGYILRAHRVVWAIFHNRWPDDFIDHVNGDRCDNRPDNLRDVTHRENMLRAARRKPLKVDDSGAVLSRGVYKKRDKYMVVFWPHGQYQYGGTFETVEEANKMAESLGVKLGLY